MYGTKAEDIVAYTFEAEMLCPPCVRIIAARYAESNGKASDYVSLPELLRFWSENEGIDTDDEYDSNDFPFPVFGSQVESDEEKCGSCHESLI